MSPVRPEQASVLVHHSWYSSRVGTAQARSTGATGGRARPAARGAAPARGRAHAARELRRTAEHQNRRIIRLQDSTIPPAKPGEFHSGPAPATTLLQIPFNQA